MGELIVWAGPVIVHCPQASNIFSSKTPGPVEAKFHMKLSWDGGTKVFTNGPGHVIW